MVAVTQIMGLEAPNIIICMPKALIFGYLDPKGLEVSGLISGMI